MQLTITAVDLVFVEGMRCCFSQHAQNWLCRSEGEVSLTLSKTQGLSVCIEVEPIQVLIVHIGYSQTARYPRYTIPAIFLQVQKYLLGVRLSLSGQFVCSIDYSIMYHHSLIVIDGVIVEVVRWGAMSC